MSDSRNEPVTFTHISCVPFDPNVYSYSNWGQLVPITYTNWREETLSWKESCYIHANLSCFPALLVSGPDCVKLLSDLAVNNFEDFTVGRAKHVIICSEQGNVIDHGVVMRLAEDVFECWFTPFYTMYKAESGGYDVSLELTDQPENRNCINQLAGPRSLEIVERATQQDLHDLGFMRFRPARIGGRDVRILRMGMGGSLAYEVHTFGDPAGLDVYEELLRVGSDYDLVKLGVNQYMCNHTENGFPQSTFHFPGAILEDPGYVEYMKSIPDFYYDEAGSVPRGSYSDDIRDYYRNPIEIGWAHMVNFEHEFVGKAALQRIAASDPRKIVTLVWNPEDLMKVFASYFDPSAEPYQDMPFPQDFGMMGPAENNFFQDTVLKDGREVGVSMWRTYTLYYRSTISMCCIDADLAEIGTEVSVLWGDSGTRQLEIRATVERFPFLDHARNRDADLDAIPALTNR